MSNELPPGVTRLLLAWNEGDPDAMPELFALVCDDLRQMARRYMSRESARHVLQPTALVHEFFLRIHSRRTVSWKNRAHFFGFAAQTMRLILVDYARRDNRRKRGAGQAPVALGADLDNLPTAAPNVEILALHQALERLEAMDERLAAIVKLRFFVGMSVEETAAALGISRATVKRDWQFAKLWLLSQLQGGAVSESVMRTD